MLDWVWSSDIGSSSIHLRLFCENNVFSSSFKFQKMYIFFLGKFSYLFFFLEIDLNVFAVQIFVGLENLLGVKHELEDGYTCTLIHCCDVGSDLLSNDVCQKVECNAKLAVALFIMDECFLPLADHRSGVNLIHNIVYNFG